MKEKKKKVLSIIDDIKKIFEQNGYQISEKTYKKITKEYLNSDKSIEEIKKELYRLVEEKIASIKSEKEQERLKNTNIEDYEDEILTIESLDKYGYPNIINSILKIYSKVNIGHNAPINVQFASKNGFYKNSANTSDVSLDKFEYIICQIGKMLNVKMAETYKVYSNNSYLGIISENVCDEHETLYMYSELPKFINKDNEEIKELIKSLEKISKNKVIINSKEKEYKIPVAETEEEISLVISSFLQVMNALNITPDNEKSIRQDYFNMIMLDFIVNNVDRNKNNYGLIISEYGEVSFSPLFDNSTIDIPNMPKGYQQINGFLVNKDKLLNHLFTNYYEDIKNITQTCLYNRDTLSNKVSSLSSKELDISEQQWFLSHFNENINKVVDKEVERKTIKENNESINELQANSDKVVEEGPKLVRTKPTPTNNITTNNNGKINIIFIILSISLILIFTTLVLLFKIS